MNPGEDFIREKIAQFEQPVRLSLSARYPPLAPLLIFARRAHRQLQNIFNFRLTREITPSFYSCVVARHQSVLFRALGDSDPRLQRQKVANLRLATAKINGLVIPPGKEFSFWHTVGAPTPARGFVKGMLLAEGEIIEGYGGGLCQLSNLLYWLFLHTPLTVTERFHHALDVFPDSGRVLPFGSGATILYNYIDLRARNTTGVPLQLKVWLTDRHLKGQVLSPERIPGKYHIFEKEHCFVLYRGRYFRFNEIWREELLNGETQRMTKITTNFAPVMYEVTPEYLQAHDFQVLRF